jgi:hypothetical protein
VSDFKVPARDYDCQIRLLLAKSPENPADDDLEGNRPVLRNHPADVLRLPPHIQPRI